MQRNIVYHLVAMLVCIVWGTTFVSTKVLILHGLAPAGIFVLRFGLSYVLLLLLAHKQLFCCSLRDELSMLLLGVSGGSMYFLCENMALMYSAATNVSLIVCSCPLFTALAVWWIQGRKLSQFEIVGALCAFVGMALVVINGRFVLHLSAQGDVLALVACFSWVVYSLLLPSLAQRYSTQMINRKVFLYGFISILPWFAWHPEQWPTWSVLQIPVVWSNLLFLALIASLLGFSLWTMCMKRLGTMQTTNYVYLNPISTVVAAHWVLGEQITVCYLIGAVLILLGLYLFHRHK